MDQIPSSKTRKPPNWFIKVSKWWWERPHSNIIAIVLNLAIGIVTAIIATLLFTVPSSLENLPIGWLFQNPLIVLIVLIVLFLVVLSLTYITYLSSQFSERLSDKELERIYLDHLIEKNKTLTLKGIPSGPTARSVSIDEVFIPLQLVADYPLVDWPISKQDRKMYDDLLARGELTEEISSVLLEDDRSWSIPSEKNEKISIATLWQKLTSERRAAVVLGFLGAGKSTLMARLTLYMARCRRGISDTTMPEMLLPPLIPILLSLKEYSDVCKGIPDPLTPLSNALLKSFDGTLSSYLEIALTKLQLPFKPVDIEDLAAFLQRCLEAGLCLVMFDGLDEVSDQLMRRKIQEAIIQFIDKWPKTPKSSTNFNRFLITSRVAGYEPAIFSNFPHCLIAGLTPEQIEAFLPRWFRASIRRDLELTTIDSSTKEEYIIKEAEKRAKALMAVIKLYHGVGDLAENPFLLTLLAAMQQSSEISKIRVELYDDITLILLQHRNIAIGLDPIYEAQAIQRLGPLAYRMQEKGSKFVLRSEVIDVLRKAIASEGGEPDQVEKQAESFLTLVRERGGLFVQRAENHFGFFHPSFQDYFVGRHLLNMLNPGDSHGNKKNDLDNEIKSLVDKVHQADHLWREPFLLAVAYESAKANVVGSTIVRVLLENPEGTDPSHREHDLLLAAECLIEAKPFTIDSKLGKSIAEQLLETYQGLLESQRKPSSQIESVVSRWLQRLPNTDFLSPLPRLVVLDEAVRGKHGIISQKTVLTLLANISGQLKSSPLPPFIVFNTLIPHFLALTGLPFISKYQPTSDLLVAANSELQELALTACIGFIIADHRRNESIVQTVRYWSARSENEIKFLLKLAEETSDGQLQQACILALGRALPQTPEAWAIMESGKHSKVAGISTVVEECLKSKLREEEQRGS